MEAGEIDLDVSIKKYLGNEDWFSRLADAEFITLRMLMSHTSGVNDHIQVDAFRHHLLDEALDRLRPAAPAG